MVKQNYRRHQRFIKQQLPERDSQQRNHGQTKRRRNQDLSGMKPDGGSGVHLRVAVMHAVKSPEEAEFVVGAVQQIQPAVKQQYGGDGGNRRRQAKKVQQSEPAPFGPPGYIGDERGGQRRYRQRVEQSKRQVPRPMTYKVTATA